MRKLVAILLSVWGLAGSALAVDALDYYRIREVDTPFIGAFTGYSGGGDIEDEEIVWGAHGSFVLTDYLLVDVAVDTFSDRVESDMYSEPVRFRTRVDVDVIDLGLGLFLQVPLGDQFRLYGGGGVSYVAYDADEGHVTVDPSTLPKPGLGTVYNSDVGLSNEWGYHLAGGLAWRLSDGFEVFAEYRLVMADRTVELDSAVTTQETHGETTLEQGYTDSATVSGSYDHGMMLAGFNFYF
jgi:opacity protein-like surface antigen